MDHFGTKNKKTTASFKRPFKNVSTYSENLTSFAALLATLEQCQTFVNIYVNWVWGHSTTTWTRRGGGGVSKKSTLVHPGGGGGVTGCPRGQRFGKKNHGK